MNPGLAAAVEWTGGHHLQTGVEQGEAEGDLHLALVQQADGGGEQVDCVVQESDVGLDCEGGGPGRLHRNTRTDHAVIGGAVNLLAGGGHLLPPAHLPQQLLHLRPARVHQPHRRDVGPAVLGGPQHIKNG